MYNVSVPRPTGYFLTVDRQPLSSAMMDPVADTTLPPH